MPLSNSDCIFLFGRDGNSVTFREANLSIRIDGISLAKVREENHTHANERNKKAACS